LPSDAAAKNRFKLDPDLGNVNVRRGVIGNTIDANNWNGIDIAERDSVFLDRFIAFDICSWTATYTPDPNFTGTDSFTYKITANGTDVPPATITIEVAEPQS
jgi:hypothetical protein